ncbi:MAG: PaaI family thioesterase [Chloroflexi bacterium]|nr:PaaI family thioesterase [Chloroflexota bacterium]
MEKQPSSKMCFVCGRDNPIGLHMHFFVESDGTVRADYVPREEEQGYPGVVHGGLLTTMLDELIGRTAIASDLWCMTAKLQVRFKKPVPVGAPLKLKGEITKTEGRLLEGRGEIRLADGTLAVEAIGTYIKIPDGQLNEYKTALEWWRVD